MSDASKYIEIQGVEQTFKTKGGIAVTRGARPAAA